MNNIQTISCLAGIQLIVLRWSHCLPPTSCPWVLLECQSVFFLQILCSLRKRQTNCMKKNHFLLFPEKPLYKIILEVFRSIHFILLTTITGLFTVSVSVTYLSFSESEYSGAPDKASRMERWMIQCEHDESRQWNSVDKKRKETNNSNCQLIVIDFLSDIAIDLFNCIAFHIVTSS